jgi:hypothetical protein
MTTKIIIMPMGKIAPIHPTFMKGAEGRERRWGLKAHSIC